MSVLRRQRCGREAGNPHGGAVSGAVACVGLARARGGAAGMRLEGAGRDDAAMWKTRGKVMRIVRDAGFGVVLLLGCLLPGKLAAQAPAAAGLDTVVFTTSRGNVTFLHGVHAKENACSSCHHESRPEKPLTAEHQKCGDCHTETPVPPMKTSLRLAIHDTEARTGTCFNCHNKAADAGKEVPVACGDCHKRDN